MSDRRDPLLTGFDRVLARIAPGVALSRARARLALEEVRRYDAAQQTRHTAGWDTPSTGANSELEAGFERVRNRARDLVRNSEYAANAVRRMTTALVGTGIQVTPQDAAEAEAWKRWATSTQPDPAGRLNLAGMCRLAVRAWREGGEAIIRRRTRKLTDGLEVPLQLQLLEGDHLDSSKLSADSSGFTILGVEHDPIGRRSGYWLFAEHPGETWPLRTRMESFRVPADQVIHLFDAERIGQVRGMSSLGVSMLRHRSVDDYQLAVRLRKRVESCFSAFVHTDDPEMSVAGASLDPTDKTGGRRRDKLAPGLITYLKGGEQVSFAQPTPTNDDSFLTQELRAIAAGHGIPYEWMTGDLSRANFSSNRGGEIQPRLWIEELQWLVLVPVMMQPIRDWFRFAYRTTGRVPGDKPDRITMPRKPWLKPTEDVAAAKESERAGYTTKSEVLRELGYTGIDEYIEERRDEMEKLKAAGLQTDTDSGAAAPGASAGNEPGKAKVPAKSNDTTTEDAADSADA